ncbi:hypothetical protein Tco_0901782 [Tanacetum coccineum]
MFNSDHKLSLRQPGLVDINVPERRLKSSCEDPPDLELKDLPSHLEYAFLEGDDKLPVIIAKNLKDEDKTALIKGTVPCWSLRREGITVVNNEENELYPLGWLRECLEFASITGKLNDANRKDHFPVASVWDQMLER